MLVQLGPSMTPHTAAMLAQPKESHTATGCRPWKFVCSKALPHPVISSNGLMLA